MGFRGQPFLIDISVQYFCSIALFNDGKFIENADIRYMGLIEKISLTSPVKKRLRGTHPSHASKRFLTSRVYTINDAAQM